MQETDVRKRKPMKNTRIAATIGSAAAVAAFTGGTAHAAPAEPAPIHVDIAPAVAYTGSVVDSSVVVNTPFGSLTTRGGDFQVVDSRGSLVAGTPLTTSKNPADWPVAARTDPTHVANAPAPQHRAELAGADASAAAPELAAAPEPTPVAEPVVHDVDASADFNGALGVAATQFGLATGVGTLAGGVVGLGVGCLAGALTGGFVAIPTGPIAAPAAALGCVMGAGIGAGIGGVTGAALLGIPVGIASAAQMYNSLHAAGDI